MSELNIDTQYPPGPQKFNVDALSRSPVGSEDADAENLEDTLMATIVAERVDANGIGISSLLTETLEKDGEELKPGH